MTGASENPNSPDNFGESRSLEAFFVRHGQSTANAEGVWQGRLEFPLSDLGREQALRAGVALSETGLFSGVYASPLARASETAEIIAGELRRVGRFGGEVARLPGLTERHGGVLQGKPFDQTREENPDLIQKFRSLPAEEAWSLVGAETDRNLTQRFARALAEIRSSQSGEPEPRVVVVAHGGVLRAFFRREFGEDVLSGTARTPNASITRISWERGSEKPELLELASTRHLEALD